MDYWNPQLARKEQEQRGLETCLICSNKRQWHRKLRNSAAAQRRRRRYRKKQDIWNIGDWTIWNINKWRNFFFKQENKYSETETAQYRFHGNIHNIFVFKKASWLANFHFISIWNQWDRGKHISKPRRKSYRKCTQTKRGSDRKPGRLGHGRLSRYANSEWRPWRCAITKNSNRQSLGSPELMALFFFYSFWNQSRYILRLSEISLVHLNPILLSEMSSWLKDFPATAT